jgi:hypothetical protein
MPSAATKEPPGKLLEELTKGLPMIYEKGELKAVVLDKETGRLAPHIAAVHADAPGESTGNPKSEQVHGLLLSSQPRPELQPGADN